MATIHHCTLILFIHSSVPLTPFPSGNHQSVLCIYECWRMEERKVPMKLGRYLETEERGRQLHVIIGPVYYKVTGS